MRDWTGLAEVEFYDLSRVAIADLIPEANQPELGANKYRILLINDGDGLTSGSRIWSVEPGAQPRRLNLPQNNGG